MLKQKTIKKAVEVKGVGIHSGIPVAVKFKPCGANSGILFQRVDLPDVPLIKAGQEYILNGYRHTALGFKGAEVQTVEHLMSALFCLEIDNLVIEINGKELPALDGSALGYLNVLKEAGIEELDSAKDVISLKEPIWINQDGNFICALPYSGFKVSYTLNHNSHPFLKTQYLDMEITPEVFEKEIAPCRTFVLEAEVEKLLKEGLGKGANYDNTLVVSNSGVVKNKLRFDDEFLRHKILDLIGDLYLLGKPIHAHFIAVKSGHLLNHQLIRRIKLLADKDNASRAQNLPGIEFKEIFDAQTIMKILPHRYPFLLVDRIIEMETNKRIVGIKNVTINEDFFNGHFPGRPVMPGVLIVEAMAQVGGVLMLSPAENRGKLAFFMSIKEAKFRKTVVPGDTLVFEVKAGKIRAKAGQLFAQATVKGEVVAEAEFMFALV